MDDLLIIERLKKAMKDTLEDISAAMLSGNVDSMEKYKYMLGQAQAYLIISQEISNLLEPKEQKNENKERDETNVIDFGNPEN